MQKPINLLALHVGILLGLLSRDDLKEALVQEDFSEADIKDLFGALVKLSEVFYKDAFDEPSHSKEVTGEELRDLFTKERS